MESTLRLVIAVLLSFVLGGATVYLWQNPQFLNSLPFVPQPKACTADAKLCPDGSSVGRVPPNCEFTPCPSAKPSVMPITNSNGIAPSQPQPSIPADWKTYKNTKLGFIIKYPPEWIAEDSTSGGSGSSARPDSVAIDIYKNGSKYPLNRISIQSNISYKELSQEDYKKVVDSLKTDWQEEERGLIDEKEAIVFEGIYNNPIDKANTNKFYTDIPKIYSKQYVLKHPSSSNIYGFQIFVYDTPSKENSNIFDQVLSTFKFTE